jgi:hypothetical protein
MHDHGRSGGSQAHGDPGTDATTRSGDEPDGAGEVREATILAWRHGCSVPDGPEGTPGPRFGVARDRRAS